MTDHIDVNGTHTWYTEAGSGPPAVLLHGGLTDSRDFSGNLDRLARSHHLYRIHLADHAGQQLSGDGTPGSPKAGGAHRNARCRPHRDAAGPGDPAGTHVLTLVVADASGLEVGGSHRTSHRVPRVPTVEPRWSLAQHCKGN